MPRVYVLYVYVPHVYILYVYVPRVYIPRVKLEGPADHLLSEMAAVVQAGVLSSACGSWHAQHAQHVQHAV